MIRDVHTGNAALPFEFAIEGPPVSQQARRRELVRQWSRSVRDAALHRWDADTSPVAEVIMLTIIYFYNDVPMDVDNIPKPILDALNGLVYVDDSQISDLFCRKRELTDRLQIESESQILKNYIRRGAHFIYISVQSAPNQEVI